MAWLKTPHGKLASREQLFHPREVSKEWQLIWPTLESLKCKLHQSIMVVKYRYRYSQGQKGILANDEPSDTADDIIIIRKDKMTRWHEPSKKESLQLFFFPFPEHNLFYPLSDILLCKDIGKRRWLGLEEQSQNGYNGFFRKTNFHLHTVAEMLWLSKK